MLARWSSASFCVRRFLSCLAHVSGSLGSPWQAETAVRERARARTVATDEMRMGSFSSDEGRQSFEASNRLRTPGIKEQQARKANGRFPGGGNRPLVFDGYGR